MKCISDFDPSGSIYDAFIASLIYVMAQFISDTASAIQERESVTEKTG